jgi:hypothetical protein
MSATKERVDPPEVRAHMGEQKISVDTIVVLSYVSIWLLSAGCNIIQLVLPGFLCLITVDFVERRLRRAEDNVGDLS